MTKSFELTDMINMLRAQLEKAGNIQEQMGKCKQKYGNSTGVSKGNVRN